MTWSPAVRFISVAVGAHALLLSAAGAQEKPTSAPAPATAQKTFATAREAADALVAASESFDVPAMKAILGPNSEDLVVTGEAAKDREAATAFAAKAREKLAVDADPKNKDRAIVSVGSQDWPLPFPIVRKQGIVAFRRDRRAAGSPLPSDRRERAGRHPDLPRVRRGPGRIRAPQAGRVGGEPVRAAHHQHAGQAGRPGVAQPGRNVGRARGRGYRPGDRARLYGQGDALPRLLLQGPEGPGPGGAAGRDGLRGEGRDDRRLRVVGGPGGVPRHRGQDLHRQPHGCRLRKGPRAREP